MTAYRRIDLEGTEVFYREGGDPSAPALLLLHGFPSSSAQYDQLMQRLAGSAHVIAPDYPGFGRSPALAGSTTFDRLADAIDAFIEAKGLDRFSLYMFDFGSPVGFRIATRHPERVQGLVLQNGNAYEVGLGPGMQALEPYWHDRAANEAASAASSRSKPRARNTSMESPTRRASTRTCGSSTSATWTCPVATR